MQNLKAIHRKHLVLTLAPLIIIAVAAVIFRKFVVHAIMTNVVLNGIIIVTACAGAAMMVLRVRAIRAEWRVFEQFAAAAPQPGSLAERQQHRSVASRLLTHLERIRHAGHASAIEQSQVQEELEDVHRVLDSRQEVAQYVVGLMIALGLLGTFIGLLETLVAVGDLIGGFAVTDPSRDMDKALAQLIGNLQYPLTAMGTAFSASMFGLLCSLMLGIMMLSVRSFQVEFLQYARSVVDEVTASAHPKGGSLRGAAADGTSDERMADDATWAQRAAEMARQQQSLHDDVRQLAVHARGNQERQGELLASLQQALVAVRANTDRVAEVTAQLSVLPVLAGKAEEAGRAAGQQIEAAWLAQRQAEAQRDGLGARLLQQLGALAEQVDRSHAQQARLAHDNLVALLDQRLGAIDERSEQARVAQQAVLAQHQVHERWVTAFNETGASLFATMRRLQESSDGHAQAMGELARTVAQSAQQAEARGERLNASLQVVRSDTRIQEIAYEVAQASERIERELRVGIGAILSLQRQAVRTGADGAVSAPEVA